MKLNIKPLSVNKAWRGRRFKTPEYEAWREQMGWILKNHANQKIQWCNLKIDFHIKNYGASDVDNMIKSTLDALVEAKVIEDDRYVKSITATKHRAKEEYICITIEPIELQKSI